MYKQLRELDLERHRADKLQQKEERLKQLDLQCRNNIQLQPKFSVCGMSFTNRKEPLRGPGQSAVLHSQHHRGGPILQICSLQHPPDPTLPHEGSSTALGPSARHLPPPLLQLAPGWTPCLHDQAFAAYPEHCSTTHVQPTESLPCDPPLP